jgi:hypothetical protein
METWLANRVTLVLPAEQLGFDKVISGNGDQTQPPLRPAATKPEGGEVKIKDADDNEVRIPMRLPQDDDPDGPAADAR